MKKSQPFKQGNIKQVLTQRWGEGEFRLRRTGGFCLFFQTTLLFKFFRGLSVESQLHIIENLENILEGNRRIKLRKSLEKNPDIIYFRSG